MIKFPELEKVTALNSYSTYKGVPLSDGLKEVNKLINSEKDRLFSIRKPDTIGREFFAYHLKEKKASFGRFYKIFKVFFPIKSTKELCYNNLRHTILTASKSEEIAGDINFLNSAYDISKNLKALDQCKSDSEAQKTWIGFFATRLKQVERLEKLHNYLYSFNFYRLESDKRNHIENTIAECESNFYAQATNLRYYLAYGVAKNSQIDTNS